MKQSIFLLLALLIAPTITSAEDWRHFRGDGTGRSKNSKPPVKFSETTNLVWKQRLPGPGASSPILVGDRIFITCYTGYGIDRKDPGNDKNLVRHLLCLDRKTGKKIWSRSVKNKRNVAEYADFMPTHGYATPSPASDGERVYAFFDTSGVHAFDLNGKPVWEADVGEGFHGWGCGGSPYLLGNLVIINAAIEDGAVIALNKATGKPVWRGKKIYSSFSTPVLLKRPNGKQELVMNMLRKLVAIDPTNGKRLWTFRTNASYGVASPVAYDDKIYAVTRMPTRLVAIKGGNRGDLTDDHLAWQARGVSNGIGSPILVDGYLYMIGRGSVLSCVNAKTGKVAYRKRVPSRSSYYASPVAANGRIYFVSRSSGIQVVQAGAKYSLLANNRFQSDDSVFNGTPAIAGNRIYLRSDKFLYCIGK